MDEIKFTPDATTIEEISGDIQNPYSSPKLEYDTINEPVLTTIVRDLKAIGTKCYHVFIPRKSQSLLKEWDLWGPLMLCVFFSLILQHDSTPYVPYDTSIPAKLQPAGRGPQFAEVFVLTWAGSVVVTLNSKLLGGSLSFFQSLCVLGYCLLPMAVALLLCQVVLLINAHSTAWFVARFFIVIIGFGWSCFASVAFLADTQPPKKKGLCLYPIFLFYFVIAWMILSHTS